MNTTIAIDLNSPMSKPKENFFINLLNELNQHNKEFPNQEELFVTMLKKSSVGKYNTEVTIYNSTTQKTEKVKYDRVELSEQLNKHTVEDKDNTGKPIRVGINSTTKQLDLEWFKGLGFIDATIEDFALIPINNAINKTTKLYNCYKQGEMLYYSGNPEYKSGINGMLAKVSLTPNKTITLRIPKNETCKVIVTTPQLLDGKTVLRHQVVAEPTSTQEDVINLTFLSDNRISITINNGEEITTKERILPPSNPMLLTIKVLYPRGNRLLGKSIGFSEQSPPNDLPLTTNLKPLKIPKHISTILKNDVTLSKMSHDFFIVEANGNQFINLKLEERLDLKQERFVRSFIIGDKNQFNKNFYNLVSGIESDSHLFKVITKDDKLLIIHQSKVHQLTVDKTKGYGFNVDTKNNVVIFNTDSNFNNLEEMHEDLTENKEHIKVFHIPTLENLKEPFVLLMEVEDGKVDNPATSLLYRIEEESIVLNTDWINEDNISNIIHIPDVSNPFVKDTNNKKDRIVIKPYLSMNLEFDNEFNILVPEYCETEKFFAYQVSLPVDTTLRLNSLLSLGVELSIISISSTIREISSLGATNLMETITLQDGTLLAIPYPLENKIEENSNEFLLERKDKQLLIHAPNNGIFVYQLDTEETIYLGQFFVNNKNNTNDLFQQSGVTYL